MPCGTRASYWRGCRCLPCRVANAAYNAQIKRNTAYGRPTSDLVDAEPVRRHLRDLMAAGMGRRTIIAHTGLSTGHFSKLLGHGKAKPQKRVHAPTAARILTVRPDLAPSTPVDATGTRRRLQALVATGWPNAQIARRMGWADGNLAAILNGHRTSVLTRTATQVRELYDQMWDERPPVGAPSRRAAARARGRGWAPPAAWDDDKIDDPLAGPAGLVRPA